MESRLLEYKNMYVVLLPKERHVICMTSDGRWDDNYCDYCYCDYYDYYHYYHYDISNNPIK